MWEISPSLVYVDIIPGNCRDLFLALFWRGCVSDVGAESSVKPSASGELDGFGSTFHTPLHWITREEQLASGVIPSADILF